VTEKSPRMLAVFGGAWSLLLVAAGALLLGTREPGPRMLRPIALDILNCGVIEGCEVEAGAGEEAAEQAGPVLHPPEPGLDQSGELGEVAFGQVGQGPFEV
jgi:hypothetical protein